MILLFRSYSSSLCVVTVCLIIISSYFHPVSSGNKDHASAFPDTNEVIRYKVNELLNLGFMVDLMKYLDQVEAHFGDLHIDSSIPSLYSYKGIALTSSSFRKHQEAIAAMVEGLRVASNDTRAWINLGELRAQTFDLPGSIEAYQTAFALGDKFALSRLLKVKGWGNYWKDFEFMASMLYQEARNCVTGNAMPCTVDSVAAMDYADCPGNVQRVFQSGSPFSKPAHLTLTSTQKLASIWDNIPHDNHELRKLKVGLVSSDFGIHPVSTLIRGVIQFMNTSRIELHAFALSSDLSWWGINVSDHLQDRFVVLDNINHFDAAKLIASKGIEILIDLNGHTLGSGLPIMSHEPAALQLSFLGLPTTSGAPFIDYYIGDTVTNPPELSDHFSEKQLMLPPCYISNDYAQLRGDILNNVGRHRAPRQSLRTAHNLDDASIVFATFSNSQKTDPNIFHVWMNIMQRFPMSKMVYVNHQGTEFGLPNMRTFAKVYGINGESRLALSPHIPWIDHLYTKTSIDMQLDTPLKNGHTTGLDAVWAGLPVISIGGGQHMQARASQSIAAALDCDIGMTYSMKEYEDLVYRLKKNHNLISMNSLTKKILSSTEEDLLSILRRHVGHQRKKSVLFDTMLHTKEMEIMLQALADATYAMNPPHSSRHSSDWKKMHIFATSRNSVPDYRNRKFPISQVDPSSSKSSGNVNRVTSASLGEIQGDIKNFVMSSLPADFFSKGHIFLNIGALCRQPGWTSVNIVNATCYENSGLGETDVIREMHDLRGFPNNSVAAIYASHILEHNPYGNGLLEKTLMEWYRVLKPGGLLFISVPNLVTLSQMILDGRDNVTAQWQAVRMIYGAQSDEHDYHQVGFTPGILQYLITSTGTYCKYERVQYFNMFQDTSVLMHGKYFISLNVVATVCPTKPYNDQPYDGFSIDHSSTPYVDKF